MDERAQKPEAMTPAEHAKRIEEWRARRLKKLTADDGWLTLVGLHWLEDGQFKIGGGKHNDIVVDSPRAPDDMGILKVRDGQVFFWSAPGFKAARPDAQLEAMELNSDAKELPTVIKAGDVSFYVIDRGGRLALRIKDNGAPGRAAFKGIKHYPVDMKWRVAATFSAYPKPEQLRVPTEVGYEEMQTSPGTLSFLYGGRNYVFKTFQASKGMWVVFGDQTNGKETYGAGRFVYVDDPKNNKTFIDFNEAYSPPCVFSRFTTCPLPPPGNRLPFRVEAGELNYDGGT